MCNRVVAGQIPGHPPIAASHHNINRREIPSGLFLMDKSSLKKIGITAGIAIVAIILYNYALKGLLQKIPLIGTYVT